MPKTLYLVRHAKSSWTDISLSDFDRPLNKRGLRDAPEMGKRLKKRKILPDTLISSPARRAIDTAEFIAKAIGYPKKSVIRDEKIYEASSNGLLEIIRSIPEHCDSAMIFGHNPSIETVANHLSDIPIERMPTCAIVIVELASSHWKDAGTCSSTLLDFDFPKKSH